MKYIRHQFKGSVRRVDMVFDVYKPDSLKSSLREKRGCGTRIRVEAKKAASQLAGQLKQD